MISISLRNQPPPMDPPLREAALRDARDAAGQAVQTALQDHWLARNAQPNANNWPKRGFWASVVQALGANVTDTSYQITNTLPAFFRRWQGGEPITPKRARRLALPAIAEAYAAGSPSAGRVPVALTTVVRRRAGRISVALAEYTERQNKRNPDRSVKVPGRVWYWLVKQANPAADPNAMPPASQLDQAATAAVDQYLAAILRARPGSITPRASA